MALKPPPPPWEVLQQLGEQVGGLVGDNVRDDVDRSVRSLAQSALSRLDVVSREEFDAQTEMLRHTRAKVVALEAELEELGRLVEQLAEDPGADPAADPKDKAPATGAD